MAQAAPSPERNRHSQTTASASSNPGQDLASLEKRRRRAARMFERGASQSEVARALGVTRQSAFRWHRAWIEGGSGALASAGKRGRSSRLTPAELKEVEDALLKGARSHGFSTDVWT